jgi:hypothetical protein
MADRVQDRFQVNVGKISQIVLNTVIEGKPTNPSLPDPADIEKGISVIKHLNADALIETFFERSWPHWPNMLRKDKNALLNSADKILPEYSSKDISTFNLLFTAKNAQKAPLISPEILEAIWAYFHQMVRQCILYGLNKNSVGDSVKIGSLVISKTQLSTLKVEWDKAKEGKIKLI